MHITYTHFVLVYYDFAYYLCCAPYRFRKRSDGNYEIRRWWAQTVMCYFQSFLYLYQIFRRFIDRWDVLVNDGRWGRGNNPILYINLMESVAYMHYTFVVVLTQFLNAKQILRFITKVEEYSRKLHNIHYHWYRNNGSIRKLLNSSTFVYLSVFIITIISLCNMHLFSNFTFDPASAIINVQHVFFWRNWNDTSSIFTGASVHEKSLENYLLAIFHVVTTSIRDFRDMYSELFFIVGIFTLWIISWDFEWIVDEETRIVEAMGLKSIQIESINIFKAIRQLSRRLQEAQGYALFSYIMFYLLYYSIKLDEIFLPGIWGVKFYTAEYLLNFAVITCVGADFHRKMACIKKLTKNDSLAQLLDGNMCVLISYSDSRRLSAIQAKVFPLTFSTITKFVAQVMVIFLICIQTNFLFYL